MNAPMGNDGELVSSLVNKKISKTFK